MFGDFIKDKRLKSGFTLREFCRQLGEDASNWSKIEREKLSPPQAEEKLSQIASILEIKKDSEDWNKLFDYASTENGKIPKYIMSEKELVNSLPIFFRTVGSTKPTTEELRELINNLKKEAK